MSGLKNMQTRLTYMGGNQVERMRKDKLSALRKALLYSYQSETAILEDGREFRCLINPNKLSMELDDKMLSIPFEDICLNKDRVGTTTEGTEEIGVKVGDTLTWKENGTHWLVYMRYLQEDAYFRGLMRQCDAEIEINGAKHWVYLKGPSEKGIDWQKTKHFVFNNLNYTLEMYISNNLETKDYFQRFKKIEVNGKPWEVQAVDDITTEGIIAVYLKEDYTNEYAEVQVEDSQPEENAPIEQGSPRIIGETNIYPFDIRTYTVENISDGIWSLSNKRAKILAQSDSSVEIEITTGKSGVVDLIYTSGGAELKLQLNILSL